MNILYRGLNGFVGAVVGAVTGFLGGMRNGCLGMINSGILEHWPLMMCGQAIFSGVILLCVWQGSPSHIALAGFILAGYTCGLPILPPVLGGMAGLLRGMQGGCLSGISHFSRAWLNWDNINWNNVFCVKRRVERGHIEEEPAEQQVQAVIIAIPEENQHVLPEVVIPLHNHQLNNTIVRNKLANAANTASVATLLTEDEMKNYQSLSHNPKQDLKNEDRETKQKILTDYQDFITKKCPISLFTPSEIKTNQANEKEEKMKAEKEILSIIITKQIQSEQKNYTHIYQRSYFEEYINQNTNQFRETTTKEPLSTPNVSFFNGLPPAITQMINKVRFSIASHHATVFSSVNNTAATRQNNSEPSSPIDTLGKNKMRRSFSF